MEQLDWLIATATGRGELRFASMVSGDLSAIMVEKETPEQLAIKLGFQEKVNIKCVRIGKCSH